MILTKPDNIQKRIFIGGVGRSGTTNLLQALNHHPQICGIPYETHIITHARGLRRMFDALTIEFSGESCTYTIIDFIYLMKALLNGDPSTALWAFRLDRLFGMEVYHDALEEFLQHVTIEGHPDAFMPLRKGTWPTACGRFFPDPEILLGHMRVFVDQLFSSYALRHGKNIWCEKTPANNLHIDFIFRLFPQAYFIHIKRNPYAIALSWLDLAWAAHNLESILNMMEGIYSRWAAFKKYADLRGYHYLEIRLEDLTIDSQGSTNALCSFLGVDSMPGEHLFQRSIQEARKDEMTPEFKKAVNERLGRFFPLLGYEIEHR